MGCCHGCLSIAIPWRRPRPVFDQPSTYRPAMVAVPGLDSARLHRVQGPGPRRQWGYAACLCVTPEPPSAAAEGAESGDAEVTKRSPLAEHEQSHDIRRVRQHQFDEIVGLCQETEATTAQAAAR